MKYKLPDKTKVRFGAVNTAGILLLTGAVALVVWNLLLRTGTLQLRYAELQNRMYEFQLSVASLNNKWLILIIIELLFALKSVLPLPVSLMFVLSGMVFPYSYAVLINAVGMLILMSIKYLWGFHFGAGKIEKKLLGYHAVQKVLNKPYGVGLVLFLSRMIPWMPLNKTSQFYGALKYPFDRYIYLSILALVPKLLIYSVIGRNVYDPFSTKFLVPLTVIFTAAGLSLLILNRLFTGTDNKNSPLADQHTADKKM